MLLCVVCVCVCVCYSSCYSCDALLFQITDCITSGLVWRLRRRSDWCRLPSTGERTRFVSVQMLTCSCADGGLLCWFSSMLSAVEPEVLAAAARCPGFLYSAVVSYRELNRLFLSGPQKQQQQVRSVPAHPLALSRLQPHIWPLSQVLLQARSILMSSISLSSPDCVTPGQRRQVHTSAVLDDILGLWR